MSKLTGWLILLVLAECLIGFAWFIPISGPLDLIVHTFTNGVPMERNMQWFGMFVACPAVIWACYLLDMEEE